MPTYGKNGSALNLEHLQLKFANAADWSESTVLLAGEIGVERDTHKFKVGDGTTTWAELPYSADPNVQTLVDSLTTRVTTAEGSITSLSGRMDTAEGNITSQGTRLTTAEGDIDALEGRMDTAESDIDSLETRMAAAEAKDVEQDGRLDALEGITSISANPFSA